MTGKEEGLPINGLTQNSIPEGSNNPPPPKKKRNLPGNPDPGAEVIALSPKTLMATNRFICEVCGKGFQRDQNLQLHRRGHNLPWKLKQRSSNEVRKRVYVCPEMSCVHHHPSRALGDLTGIKKHYSRKHGEKKWKCDKCSKRYAVQSDWKAHSKTCGTREYRCDCGTLFTRKDSFITHRAFCDALAEETARISTTSDIQSNYHFMGAPQPLWMGQATSQSFGSDPMSVVTSCTNPISQLSFQLNWNIVGSPQRTEEEENGVNKNQAVSVPSLFSSQFHHQTPNANMSATALLQKAAWIGSATTDPSLFLGSLGLMCDTNHVVEVHNVNNNVNKFYGLYGATSSSSAMTAHLGSDDMESQVQMYPSKRHKKNEESLEEGGQTRDFLGVGVHSICSPSSVNRWI